MDAGAVDGTGPSIVIIDDHPAIVDGVAAWCAAARPPIRILDAGDRLITAFVEPGCSADVVVFDLQLRPVPPAFDDLARLVEEGRRVVDPGCSYGRSGVRTGGSVLSQVPGLLCDRWMPCATCERSVQSAATAAAVRPRAPPPVLALADRAGAGGSVLAQPDRCPHRCPDCCATDERPVRACRGPAATHPVPRPVEIAANSRCRPSRGESVNLAAINRGRACRTSR